MKKNNFNFHIPLDIVKATNAQGEEVLRLKGVAATKDRDDDGEIIDPNGFDLDYFLNYGFVNWHHGAKDNPATIIGEPVSAIIKNSELHVEVDLYPESEMARSVYALAQTLKNNPKTKRKLGMSIEGKALAYSPLDKTYVTKARLTGLAITPMPKNSHTLVDVIKGHVEEDFIPEYETSIESNGGKTLIIDLETDNYKVTVDKDFRISIKKALSTESGSALMPESVEGKLKPQNKVQTFIELDSEEFEKAIVTLSKAYENNLIDDNEKNRISSHILNNIIVK